MTWEGFMLRGAVVGRGYCYQIKALRFLLCHYNSSCAVRVTWPHLSDHHVKVTLFSARELLTYLYSLSDYW